MRLIRHYHLKHSTHFLGVNDHLGETDGLGNPDD